MEIRKGSLCVRPKLGLEKRKGPGEKERSRLPTSSVPGRAVKRSRKAGVCFLLPFPASQETRAQARSPPLHPDGVQWQSPPRNRVGSHPALGVPYAPPSPPGGRLGGEGGPWPSRDLSAAKWGRFCDEVTAKWCDRRSCRRGRTALHREALGGSWRRPEAATEQGSPAQTGGRAAAAGGEGEPATSTLAPRRSPWTRRNKPRLQQGLRLHESLGFFFLSPLLTPHPGSRPAFSLRRQRLRPGAESRADRNGVQPRTGGNSAHRAAGKGRGPGARRWRGREGGREGGRGSSSG